jgi:hypothetical protein
VFFPSVHDQRLRHDLERAYDALPADDHWRGALATALEALGNCDAGTDEDRFRAICWLHDGLAALVPRDPANDHTEQRLLRRAVTALRTEIIAQHVRELRAA